MAQNQKLIKNRIKSIRNTQKITKAMQMIASIKAKNAVHKSLKSKDFALASLKLLEKLSKSRIEQSKYKNNSESEYSLLILISSSKGLCGSYNTNIYKFLKSFLEQNKQSKFKVIAIGNKSAKFARKLDLELIQIYSEFSEGLNIKEIYPISRTAIDMFLNDEVKDVKVIYTEYISVLKQEVKISKLLPLADSNLEEEEIQYEYEFEPSRNQIIDFIIPMIIETQIYQSVVESLASENTARMLAMQKATDAAKEISTSLNLEYNKARQASITQEIIEVVSGSF